MQYKSISREDARTLEKFVGVCEDGKNFYEHAAEETDNQDLRRIFIEQATTRISAINALKPEYEVRTEEQVDESGTIVGSLHKWYTDAKRAIKGKEDENFVLVEQLEELEDRTLSELRVAIEDIENPTLEKRLTEQLTVMHQTHDRMKALKETLRH
ncbi:PA2169 family four-helix-bundle protein [Pokkaliibacter sp. CJK22405]|uniref:PA2169 family four-helix-bundle protein n=1 Tax=Pokkaliibacter sp. CJK22405 TaxID=3384615 RepID=UPI0039855141